MSDNKLMTAQILDGKWVSEQIQQTLREKAAQRFQKGLRPPALAVILVGNDPASAIYVKNKKKTCESVGFISYSHNLPDDVSEEAVLNLIESLNQDINVHGILIQLPLPKHIDSQKIIEAINPHKDVDGFHPYNLGRLAQRQPFIRPCTPYGILQLLSWYHLNLKGLHAVVVGASNIVGRPMSLELLISGATVTTCHRFTQKIEKHVADADLLVAATGKMDIIHPEWIKPGAIVVDVGIHRLENGKIRGDLDFALVAERAAWLTPVPFGVGPMTITALLCNTLFCAELLDKTRDES